MDIKHYLNEKRILIEKALTRYIPATEDETLAEHIKAMQYSLFAGGKRVRPILCLAAAAAVGREDAIDEILPTACALECIHSYSLIHDDLPAMDDDDLRRGKPTNHKVFGEAGAILAGDGLLTLAFELISDPGLNKARAGDRLRVIHIISRAAGPFGMVGGQVMDLAGEGKKIPFEILRLIHSRKTGALITASVAAGAVLGGGDQKQLENLTTYGQKIGLAFQIVDDLLNVEGTEEQLGKAAGSDAERRKATYPAFFGVEKTREMAHRTVTEAIASLADFDEKAEPLRGLARYIVDRKR